MSHTYYTYILTNTTNTVLYIGVSNDISRRTIEHINGNSSFTKRYSLHKLIYFETYSEIIDAIQREKQLKRWTRAKKNALVEMSNPDWNDLRPLL